MYYIFPRGKSLYRFNFHIVPRDSISQDTPYGNSSSKSRGAGRITTTRRQHIQRKQPTKTLCLGHSSCNYRITNGQNFHELILSRRVTVISATETCSSKISNSLKQFLFNKIWISKTSFALKSLKSLLAKQPILLSKTWSQSTSSTAQKVKGKNIKIN